MNKKIGIVLLLALLVFVAFQIFSNKEAENVKVAKNPEVKVVEEELTEEEKEKALESGNGIEYSMSINFYNGIKTKVIPDKMLVVQEKDGQMYKGELIKGNKIHHPERGKMWKYKGVLIKDENEKKSKIIGLYIEIPNTNKDGKESKEIFYKLDDMMYVGELIYSKEEEKFKGYLYYDKEAKDKEESAELYKEDKSQGFIH